MTLIAALVLGALWERWCEIEREPALFIPVVTWAAIAGMLIVIVWG